MREMLRRGISILTLTHTNNNNNNNTYSVERHGGEGKSVCGMSSGGGGGEKRDKNESPPDDDVCPICFGHFSVPCKTNCGHWFCGSCIMQFWYYKAMVKRCKCPICSRLISVLTPEACLLGRQEKEVIDVLKNVHKYNCRFQGGFAGLLQDVLALPLLIHRIFKGLMDPDRFRINYYTARLIGLMLGLLYNISPFNFIPTGGYTAHRLFELCAILLVVVLCLIGLCCRAISRRRFRRLVHASGD